ncbi:uncharacterized protein LY89DRAFT_688449 [Mollisia scopiformis]|uniref:Uncharacterized protein n=1 Tax=Mollisia scopiformis TaxID=149040 RepID=A0A194WVH2_MOLSC|nr:uncharacterized protein LY89DRAFT_688449 [Mollisia scopiformis]KUJ11968.1 hypothetical protein LY89DRAFT_688449 [Mollisia scopiformis]
MDLDSEPSTPRMNTAAKAPVKDKRKTISLTEYNAMKKTKTNPSTDDTASPTVQKTTGQTTDGIVGWANNITSAVASALGSGKAGGVQQKEGQSSKSSARAAPTPTSHPDWTLPARPSMVVPANFKLNADDWHPDTTPLINQAAMVQKYARDADRAATRLARDTAALEKSKKEGK